MPTRAIVLAAAIGLPACSSTENDGSKSGVELGDAQADAGDAQADAGVCVCTADDAGIGHEALACACGDSGCAPTRTLQAFEKTACGDVKGFGGYVEVYEYAACDRVAVYEAPYGYVNYFRMSTGEWVGSTGATNEDTPPNVGCGSASVSYVAYGDTAQGCARTACTSLCYFGGNPYNAPPRCGVPDAGPRDAAIE